jgi:hypothetical protein
MRNTALDELRVAVDQSSIVEVGMHEVLPS